MEIRTFRNLIAWQKAMDLAEMIYDSTRRMPTSEQFGLTSQMRRAAVSVPSNISEGYGRQSTKEYLRFLKTARGSLAELMTQYELTIRLNFLELDQKLMSLLEEEDRILQGLIRSIQKKGK